MNKNIGMYPNNSNVPIQTFAGGNPYMNFNPYMANQQPMGQGYQNIPVTNLSRNSSGNPPILKNDGFDKDFPESLKDYVERAFSKCQNPKEKTMIEKNLKSIITNARMRGEIYTRNWKTFNLPTLPREKSFSNAPISTLLANYNMSMNKPHFQSSDNGSKPQSEQPYQQFQQSTQQSAPLTFQELTKNKQAGMGLEAKNPIQKSGFSAKPLTFSIDTQPSAGFQVGGTKPGKKILKTMKGQHQQFDVVLCPLMQPKKFSNRWVMMD